MTKKYILIALLLVAAALVVGVLIYCRPMAASSYADGTFTFSAVDEITVELDIRDGGRSSKTLLVLTGDDEAFSAVIGLFDGRGFGRDLGNLFGGADTEAEADGVYWKVSFHSVTGGTLRAESRGGGLYLSEDGLSVTTSDKDKWLSDVSGLLLPLTAPDDDSGVSE